MRIMILIIALFSPCSVHAEDRTSDDEGVVSGWVLTNPLILDEPESAGESRALA